MICVESRFVLLFITYYLFVIIMSCLSLCRMVKVFRFHSIEKQSQVAEQEDSEDKGNG